MNCKSGYLSCTAKIPVIKAPRDQDELKKWSDVVSRRDRILAEKDHRDLMKKRLCKGAVPSIFPNCTKRLSRRRKDKRTVVTERPITPKEEEMLQTVEVDDDSNSLNLLLFKIDPALQDIPTILFESIFSGETLPSLPSKAWAIHCSSLPVRTIVVSELGIPSDSDTDLAPLYLKQIVFDDRLNFEVFFVNTRTVLKDKPCSPQSLADFEFTISYINNIKVCAGGPGTNVYTSINPEYAYKDPTKKWRHNLCTLETAGEIVCKSCASLHDLFQRRVRRSKQSSPMKKKLT